MRYIVSLLGVFPVSFFPDQISWNQLFFCKVVSETYQEKIIDDVQFRLNEFHSFFDIRNCYWCILLHQDGTDHLVNDRPIGIPGQLQLLKDSLVLLGLSIKCLSWINCVSKLLKKFKKNINIVELEKWATSIWCMEKI